MNRVNRGVKRLANEAASVNADQIQTNDLQTSDLQTNGVSEGRLVLNQALWVTIHNLELCLGRSEIGGSRILDRRAHFGLIADRPTAPQSGHELQL